MVEEMWAAAKYQMMGLCGRGINQRISRSQIDETVLSSMNCCRDNWIKISISDTF